MAQWVVPQLTALCTILSFFYISESLERHSLTERPRLSSLLVLLLSGCTCFAAGFLSKWLPGANGRFTASRRQGQGGPVLGGDASDAALFQGSHANLPSRPRKLSVPLLIFCIVVRLEVFHRVNYMQQCSTPGLESFLCLILIAYEIFSTRRRWGFPMTEDSGDPWRSLYDDLYDWFSGPRVTLVMNVLSAFAFSLGTFLSINQFTRSTYFCFSLIDSRSEILLLQFVSLLLDAAITILLWRLLAWTRTAKLRLQTLGTVLTLSSLFVGLLWMSTALYSGPRRLHVPFGSLYGFDVVVDSFAFACLMISATFWVCETSPITPAAIVTFLVGFWSCSVNLFHLGDWEHSSKAGALGPLWIVTGGAILFAYCHDLRMVLFLRRTYLVILLSALLLAATIFTLFMPLQTFDKRHPINDLIYRAHIEHDRWLREVSSSADLHNAIATYQKGHGGKNPPPRFEDWYNFAKGSIVIDVFPQIERDLAPFWNVPPETLRQRVELLTTQPKMPAIIIRNSEVSISDTGDEGKNQDLDEVADLIKAFSKFIPDMVLPINLSPTPQILPSWEEAHSQSRKDLSSIGGLFSQRSDETNRTQQLLAAENGVQVSDDPKWDFTSAKDFRTMKIEACPPGSKARTDPHWNIGAFCSECVSSHSQGQALKKFDKSLETCSQPDLTYLHGFSMTNPRSPPIRHLLPLFSASKTDEFSDIIIPLPRSRLEEPDIKWQYERRYDSLIWRGSIGGHAIGPQTLRGSHKYRLLHLIMDPNPGDVVTMVLPRAGRKDKFGYEKVSATEANMVVPFSVGVDGFSSCMGASCELIKKAYGTRAEGEEILEYRYVLLLDEDDGPPAQMMRALRSNSLPMVSTVFRTWYTDRLMPWLHFVPVDPRYQALHSTYAYFTGTERRPSVNGRETNMPGRSKDAEWIVQEGQKWVDKGMGEYEMQVYLFRLLLEWARLLDDGRDTIGTWKDEEGKLHDSGWTAKETP